jgi:hypothetical protein
MTHCSETVQESDEIEFRINSVINLYSNPGFGYSLGMETNTAVTAVKWFMGWSKIWHRVGNTACFESGTYRDFLATSPAPEGRVCRCCAAVK